MMASRPLCQVLYVSCIISPITGFCLYHNFLYMICMLLDNKDYFIVIVIVIQEWEPKAHNNELVQM